MYVACSCRDKLKSNIFSCCPKFKIHNFKTFHNKQLVMELTKALFRCENFLDFATVTLSFVCGKYCLIIN